MGVVVMGGKGCEAYQEYGLKRCMWQEANKAGVKGVGCVGGIAKEANLPWFGQ